MNGITTQMEKSTDRLVDQDDYINNRIDYSGKDPIEARALIMEAARILILKAEAEKVEKILNAKDRYLKNLKLEC